MKTLVVHELNFEELKERLERAVRSILKGHRGSTAYISLRQVIRRAGLPNTPVYNTVVIECLKSLKRIDINRSSWRLSEVTRSYRTRFVYRKCYLITDFLG